MPRGGFPPRASQWDVCARHIKSFLICQDGSWKNKFHRWWTTRIRLRNINLTNGQRERKIAISASLSHSLRAAYCALWARLQGTPWSLCAGAKERMKEDKCDSHGDLEVHGHEKAHCSKRRDMKHARGFFSSPPLLCKQLCTIHKLPNAIHHRLCPKQHPAGL